MQDRVQVKRGRWLNVLVAGHLAEGTTRQEFRWSPGINQFSSTSDFHEGDI